MATVDIVQRVKTILYGHGIGEKPILLRCAADAVETVSGRTVTFTMLDAAEAAFFDAGDVMSVWEASAATGAHMVYVLSVSGAVVTGINGYMGSPDVADTNLDGEIVENLGGGTISEHILYQSVETTIETLLWPDIWERTSYAITPQLDDFQVELNSAVEKIINAFQVIGTTRHEVPFDMMKNVHTSVSSTTVIAMLAAFDSSSVFIETINRITESSTMNTALEQLIATGAAALAAGGTTHEATLESSGKDNQIRLERSASRAIWRDFGTLRTAMAEDLSQEIDWFEYDRG